MVDDRKEDNMTVNETAPFDVDVFVTVVDLFRAVCGYSFHL